MDRRVRVGGVDSGRRLAARAARARGAAPPRRSPSRTPRLLQPASANRRGARGRRRTATSPPSGHQFVLHVAAPAQPRQLASCSGVVVLRWSEIESGESAAISVTARRPARSRARRQRLPRAGLLVLGDAGAELAGVARASRGRGRPGAPPPVSATSRRSARPMVRFARQPGPSAPMPALRPIASRTGPLTTMSWPGGEVVTAWPLRLKASSSAASHAARTTGKYAGRQPASTAQAATRSSVASPMPGGTGAERRAAGRGRRASRPPASRVGGTTGSPSVQPRSNRSSISSRRRRARRRRADRRRVVRRLRAAARLLPAARRGERRGAARRPRRGQREQRRPTPPRPSPRRGRPRCRRAPRARRSARSRGRTRATCRTAAARTAPCRRARAARAGARRPRAGPRTRTASATPSAAARATRRQPAQRERATSGTPRPRTRAAPARRRPDRRARPTRPSRSAARSRGRGCGAPGGHYATPYRRERP